MTKEKKENKSKFPSSFGVLEATWKKGVLTVLVYNHGNNETLVYSDVPRRVFDELKEAESKGSYFNRNIRNNYPYLGQG